MAIAFVFPGQGSQSVGMLADFAETDTVRKTFETASSVLGYDLWEVVQHGPRERLDVTDCTQPAMLTVGVAMWRLWQERSGPLPQVLAGHSLGEYTALVCASALDFATAISLVQFRGRVMQEAVPSGTGAMAAVLGMDDEIVEQACTQCSSDTSIVEPVNYNSPGQVVIAGHCEAVERAIEMVRGRGARRAILLAVSVPSHSSLMKPAAAQLRKRLDETEFTEPAIADIYTVGVKKHSSIDGIRSSLVEQVHKPVRWTDTIRRMIDDDKVTNIIECGPGRVLTGLNRRIERDRSIVMGSIFDSASLQSALDSVAEKS